MSLNKSSLSTEESSSSYIFSGSEAREAEELKVQPKPPLESQGHKDSVEEFTELFSPLSFDSAKGVYDQPFQVPGLVPPISSIQESFSSSSVNKAMSGIQENKATSGIEGNVRIQAQKKAFFGNVVSILDGLEGVIDKMIQDLAQAEMPEVKKKVSFMRQIADAIRALKSVLQEMMQADQLVDKNLNMEKFNQVQAQLDRITQGIQKQEQMEVERKKGELIATVMKVLGPILSVLATVIGAALAIFTFGASLAIVLAGVAVGAAFTTFSIVDTATGAGVIGQVMKAFNEWIQNCLPDSPAWVHSLVKIAIVVTVVVVLVIVGVVASGVVAANVIGKTAIELAKTFTGEVTKQLTYQLIPLAILSSNVIPELIANIMKAGGASEKDQRIAEIVLMLVQIIAVIAGLFLSAKGGGNAKAPKPNPSVTAFGASMRYFGRGGKSFINLASGCSALIVAKKTGLSPDQMQAVIETIKSASITLLMTVHKVIDLGHFGLQAAVSMIYGFIAVEQAKILRDVGDLKATEELIQAIIQFLEKILSNVKTGMELRSDFIQKIQEALQKFYEDINQNATRLYRPVQG